MNPALNHLAQTMAKELGPQLEAVFFLGGSAEPQSQTAVSQPNLLLIVQPGSSIHSLRQSFQPIWQQQRGVLQRAPLVANRPALQRHLHLNPHLALRLLQHGQQLAGSAQLSDLFRTSVNPYEIYAHFSQQLLDASAALGQENGSATSGLLLQLARQMADETAEQTGTAVSQFSTVQQALTAVIGKLPAAKTWNQAQIGPTSPTIPGLQAIYTENQKNIFVFNQLTPQRIQQINWQALAQHLPQTSGTLHVTTVAQFCLMALYDKALDLRFNKYQHKWGIHFLARLTPSSRQILRQAARMPSHILVDALPHSYLTAANDSNDTLHKIIHDYQNRMLNIQLENELLFRLGLIPAKFVPPEPLPERDVSAKQRLDAIFQHLEWWANYYQTVLQTQT